MCCTVRILLSASHQKAKHLTSKSAKQCVYFSGHIDIVLGSAFPSTSVPLLSPLYNLSNIITVLMYPEPGSTWDVYLQVRRAEPSAAAATAAADSSLVVGRRHWYVTADPTEHAP